MVVTPGPHPSYRRRPAALLAADEDSLTSVDPVNYANEPDSDADGRIMLPVLIPVRDLSRHRLHHAPGRPAPVRKEFTVKPGETLDLGDVVIAKPRS